MIANLFLGESGGARLLEADQGSHDDGERVYARLETVAAGPGLGGEAIFTALFIGIENNADADVDVTPIITGANEDGTPFERELETQQITLHASAERTRVQYQLGVSDPLIIGGVEVGRFAARATWFRVRIVALVHSPGDLLFHGLGVEMEVVREAIPTQAPAPVPAGS
jgi:hypothetical protein